MLTKCKSNSYQMRAVSYLGTLKIEVEIPVFQAFRFLSSTVYLNQTLIQERLSLEN